MLTLKSVLQKIESTHRLIGREGEVETLVRAILANRSVLIEGPVGAGKTWLAQVVAQAIDRPVLRVDGDSRYTESKLVGYFDPSRVLAEGYKTETFIAGPLVQAMQAGGILFLNELNRMPESVQNILLPAMDESFIQVPNLGTIQAKLGFLVVATQNPREFVATSHISEALLDRMEWMQLQYQSFDDEVGIVKQATQNLPVSPALISVVVGLVRATRTHPKLKRGASVRAAISMIQMLGSTGFERKNEFKDVELLEVARLALPNRIEFVQARPSQKDFMEFFDSLMRDILDDLKKKP